MTIGSDFAFARDGSIADTNKESRARNGLTVREYFAAKALQGLLSDGETISSFGDSKIGGATETFNNLALVAIDAADALIKALNK
jgi:hypothetical protein